MIRSALTVAIFALTANAAQAFDIENMSEADRATFRGEIREYLLENPEIIMEAIQVLEARRNQQAALDDVAMIENNRQEIFDDGTSYIGGNPDGDVTIVEFLDYRCGFCKRAFPALEELLASDGNIRFIVKEFPILGEASVLASRYALAVKFSEGDDAYKEVHDTLMLHNGNVNEGFLARLSGQLDLDHSAIETEMNSDQVNGTIAANRALAQKLAIQGTPSFIMGENFVRGFVELDQMRAIVQGVRDEQS